MKNVIDWIVFGIFVDTIGYFVASLIELYTFSGV